MGRLGDLLRERGLITEQDYAHAAALQRDAGLSLGPTLVRLGALSEDALLSILSEQLGLPLLEAAAAPGEDEVNAAARALGIPLSWLIDNEVIVWRDPPESDGSFSVAGPRLHDPAIQEAIEQWRAPVKRLHLASALVLEPILIALSGSRARAAGDLDDTARLLELAEEAPVIDFVNAVFAEAIAVRASDVHFEPFEEKIIVRLRIDGVLSQRRTAARAMFDAVSSRIKLLSGMDIAERRLPQDGRQTIRIAGRDIDVRVSTIPTTWGESIVVRLLGASHRIPELEQLGLEPRERDVLLETIQKPNGLVLLTGPTGSGKTTTVYRLISHLNDGVRKIVTIEDPVEFDLPGVLQMTVRPDIGLDFAAGLRSILRQDPNVIFVGEIRDSETAKTAVQAALTGHLVISTVHTNSALGAAPRLLDLGVERYLLADVLRAVVGQRLVRRICPQCAAPDPHPDYEARAERDLPAHLRTGAAHWRKSVGCPACAGTGFQGRIGVFEAALVDSALSEAIRNSAPESALAAIARTHGCVFMPEQGLVKARRGETTFLETLRVAGTA